MGGGSYSTKDWTTFSTSRGYHDPSTKTEHIYSKRTIDKDLDPLNFRFRESRDSIDNPQSTPLILGLDVTGSMNPVLDKLAREGMKTVCEEIYDRKPITDPHICTLGIGDVESDQFPLQATQFEADIRIFEALEKLYLEKGGGGNDYESYILAWYFAKFRTLTDSFAKRGVKGYVITVGDECVTPVVRASDLKRFLGEEEAHDWDAPSLFKAASEEWRIYHIILTEGTNYHEGTPETWRDAIGAQHVISLDDYTKLGETVVSLLEVCSGKNLKDVTGTWDGSTGLVVGKALQDVEVGSVATSGGGPLGLDEAVM